jgi:hypothetical protein
MHIADHTQATNYMHLENRVPHMSRESRRKQGQQEESDVLHSLLHDAPIEPSCGMLFKFQS